MIDDEDLLARVRELGERLRHALAELPGVVEVRGRGLMLAFELDPDYRPGAADIVAARAARAAPGPQRDRARRPSACCRRCVIDEAQADDAVARLRAVVH